jgi:enterochelin esterase-like enzyme
MRAFLRCVSITTILVLALGVYASPDASTTELIRVIAEIEAGRTTTPLVGGARDGDRVDVTFLARRAANRVPRIISDVTGWGERIDGTFDFNVGTMTRIGRTDWYSLKASVAPGARIEYLLAYGLTDYRLDPHNPRTSDRVMFGASPASEFVTPGYVAREDDTRPTSAAGTLSQTSIRARTLPGKWTLTVYTPPEYRATDAYPVAVFLDGRSLPVSRVLDSLIAGHDIEPVIAVFAVPDLGGGEYVTGLSLRTFLADELMPWLASRFGIAASASERAILGMSFGARDALDAAVYRSDVFSKVGLLIPGRRLTSADIDALATRARRHLQVVILAGLYDQANLPTARKLRQALADAGHAVDYIEVPEGHSPVTCFSNLRRVLVSLFGRPREGAHCIPFDLLRPSSSRAALKPSASVSARPVPQ